MLKDPSKGIELKDIEILLEETFGLKISSPREDKSHNCLFFKKEGITDILCVNKFLVIQKFTEDKIMIIDHKTKLLTEELYLNFKKYCDPFHDKVILTIDRPKLFKYLISFLKENQIWYKENAYKNLITIRESDFFYFRVTKPMLFIK